jgi:probable F420-dependent oxidoreductase
MKVDAGQYAPSVDAAANAAVAAERDGYDGWCAFETQIDPFLGCAVAAERTERIDLGTSIVVAFARNPMTVALQANDVQALSGGRFTLGLGSQIKPHITRRYSMPWSKPAARMREFILAVRAIWDCWATDGELDFEGDFYTHTLMAPFFNPGPNPHGNPKIMLAAVGPLMTQAAGEVADGVLIHAFSTERYMREATLPALEKGFEKAGRTIDGFEITAPAFVVARDTEEEIAEGAAFVKQQIAFYGSTPAYRPVLELHGWGDLQTELNGLSKQGKWQEMGELIDDDILSAFAIVAEPEEIGPRLSDRYGDVVDRISFYAPFRSDPDRWTRVMAALKAA